ncbi:MAG: hypothetical protein IIZ93_10535 [Acidaminococcaceae bacterium]|nr:hypothetical protein [Acidaminococcaceae bacterium]
MYQVNGFKDIRDARKFKKEHGGIILYHMVSIKTGKPTQIAKEYDLAIRATGLDPKANPYIVERRI